MPDYAVITNRVARHAGIALIGSFMAEDRRWSMTTDARLVPASKLKPALGSTFHGVDVSEGKWHLPVGFVRKEEALKYDVAARSFKKVGPLVFHTAVQLTGKSTKIGDTRLVEAEDGAWIQGR